MGAESKWKHRAVKYKRAADAMHAADAMNAAGVLDATGVPRRGWYVWRIRPRDIPRTRPDHLQLNGRKFRWEDPPVVNPRTGERGHPGVDAQCRCYAEPVNE